MAFWQFRPLNPNDNSGTSTAEDNFAQEERTNVDILVRESIQNPLDARSSEEAVAIHFHWLFSRTDASLSRDLLAAEWRQHLSYAGMAIPEVSGNGIPFLAIEDFGTSGLCGTYNDSDKDGPGENWNAFWFREGEGVKPTKANGGAGQGKLTLYLASQVRTLIALTERISDNQLLVAGGCRFGRNYQVKGQRFAREARWGNTADPNVLSTPIHDSAALAKYEEDLGLSRANKCGTSFLIPFPDPDITAQSIRAALLNEFYFPILRNRLTVTLGTEEISSSTIAGLAEAHPDELRTPPRYRRFLASIAERATNSSATDAAVNEAWEKETKLAPEVFDFEQLERLRTKFETGEIVEVRFPVRITTVAHGEKTGQLRVFLQLVEEAAEAHELFIRQDLAIDKEKSLSRARRLVPTMALTLIDDSELSQFLSAAEEPTHREWNARRPRLENAYRRAPLTLRSVRNAAARLVELLAPPAAKDSSALASFFPDYSADPTPKTGAAKKKTSPTGPTTSVANPPAPRPRKVDLRALDDGAMVKADAARISESDLPIHCRLEVAYATEFGNPYHQWDAADFYLTEKSEITMDGVGDVSFEGNKVTFVITAPNGWLVLAGFDTNRQLEARLTYQESTDAGDIANN